MENKIALIDADGYEKWKPIKGYEGFYEISHLGRVKSLARKVKCNKNNHSFRQTDEIYRKVYIGSIGYPVVGLNKNGKSTLLFIHRLIAQAFIPNPENLPEVNHLNGIKKDFSLKNLEWCDGCRNVQHSFEIGLHSNVRPIVQYTLEGVFIRKWDTIQKACRELKLYSANIIRCCKFERHHEGGFQWRYYDGVIIHKIKKSKAFENKPKEVLQYDIDGNFLRRWGSMGEICSTLNLSKGALSFHLNKKHIIEWKGYKWEFATKK